MLDRRYWGVSFYKELHEKYTIDMVTLGKSNLDACDDVRSLVALKREVPVKRRVKREKGEVISYLLEMIPVGFKGPAAYCGVLRFALGN